SPLPGLRRPPSPSSGRWRNWRSAPPCDTARQSEPDRRLRQFGGAEPLVVRRRLHNTETGSGSMPAVSQQVPAESAEQLTELVSMRVERDGPVAEVTLLGPAKGNAMGPDFWRELPLVFRTLDADSEIRAIVLSGSGEHFSYGLDLHAMMPQWSQYL